MWTIWKGAISFGLVNVPVRLYSATAKHDVSFHQVHEKDGGRIKTKRFCTQCGEQVPYEHVAKGYEDEEGRQVILTDADMAQLPLKSNKNIEVLEFVPVEQVDPLLLNNPYYLAPEKSAAKPYALLRDALASSNRMALVKVAIRQRESLALLRVRGDVIVMQTLLWADEIRQPDFEIPHPESEIRKQELAMAHSLIETLAADFDPSTYQDEYTQAVSRLVAAKLDGSEPPQAAEPSLGAEVVDLLEALQRSVARTKQAQGDHTDDPNSHHAGTHNDVDTKEKRTGAA